MGKKEKLADGKRYSILTEDMDRCFICGKFTGIQKHEIFGGSNREKSKYYGLVVPLCSDCHKDVHVHPRSYVDLKVIGQKAFEKKYGISFWKNSGGITDEFCSAFKNEQSMVK